MAEGLYESSVEGFPRHRGKVRDVYDLGETMLIVATDRLSAFDVVFPDIIPGKGRLLTALSRWWFERTEHIVAHHLLSTEPADYPAAVRPWAGELEGRSMLVRKAAPLRAEFIVRGYLDGSAWQAYRREGRICGIDLLAGLRRRSCFGVPLFTPTTKAEQGHDEPIDFRALEGIVGAENAAACRDYSTALYTFAHNLVREKGLVLSDTKFEFGIGADGKLLLIDEALTPDSSRYWIAGSYTPEGSAPKSLDKQFVRDHVEEIRWDKRPPAPRLPAEIINQTLTRYREAYETVTGMAWRG